MEVKRNVIKYSKSELESLLREKIELISSLQQKVDELGAKRIDGPATPEERRLLTKEKDQDLNPNPNPNPNCRLLKEEKVQERELIELYHHQVEEIPEEAQHNQEIKMSRYTSEVVTSPPVADSGFQGRVQDLKSKKVEAKIEAAKSNIESMPDGRPKSAAKGKLTSCIF